MRASGSLQPQHLATQVMRAADAGGAEADLARLRARGRQKRPEIRCRQRRPRHQEERAALEQHDRREIALDVVGQLLLQRHVHRERSEVAHAEGVAVGRRLCHGVGADHATRARAVLDHHRLAERLRELGADLARAQVAEAAGRIGHDPSQRLRRPRVLRVGRRGGKEREREGGRAPAHCAV